MSHLFPCIHGSECRKTGDSSVAYLGDGKERLGEALDVLELSDRVDALLDGAGVSSARGVEDVLDLLLVRRRRRGGVGVSFTERAKEKRSGGSADLDLAVGPLAVGLANEGRDVAEEDGKGAEDDNLLVQDKELVRDGGGGGRGGQGDDASLGDERVAGQGIDQGRRVGRGSRLTGRLESNPVYVYSAREECQSVGWDGLAGAAARHQAGVGLALGCERATHGASARGWRAWRLTRAAADRSIVEVRDRVRREARAEIVCPLCSLRRVVETGSLRRSLSNSGVLSLCAQSDAELGTTPRPPSSAPPCRSYSLARFAAANSPLNRSSAGLLPYLPRLEPCACSSFRMLYSSYPKRRLSVGDPAVPLRTLSPRGSFGGQAVRPWPPVPDLRPDSL